MEKKILDDAFKKYGWTPEQRKRFLQFVEEKEVYSNKSNTLKSYLTTLNWVVLRIKKPFSDITFKDLIPLLKEWQQEYAATTVHTRKNRLSAFLRWESGNKHDLRAEKIHTGAFVSPVTLGDLLTDEEIKKMREVAKEDPRNLALLDFHLLWGPRPGESIKLKVGDVKVTDRYLVVHIPQAKTTFRPVPIPLADASVIDDPVFLDSALNAFISLRMWLTVHPGYPDHPDYPLWYYSKGIKPLSVQGLSCAFERIGKKAGIKKSVSTYTLRRTAFNRFKGADREKLCAGFGWVPGSKMPTKVYNKLRPQDVLGTLIKDEGEPPRNIHNCPKCQKENPEDYVFCAWCGAPLVDLPAAATLEQFHADQKAHEEFEEMKEKMGG